jgi:hypothetical protein
MRAVLITIADAANRDGDHARPGKDAIVEGSLYGRSMVTRVLARLITERWVEVEEWGAGRGQATVYRVLMGRDPTVPQPVTSPPSRVPDGQQRGHSVAASRHRKGPIGNTKGATLSPKAATGPSQNTPPTVLPTETLPTASARDHQAATDDLRAGFVDKGQETATPSPPGQALLDAVARAVPTCAARHELLVDPDQAPGRATLRRRLAELELLIGFDAAVACITDEWPESVNSPMAFAIARADRRLGRPVRVAPVAPRAEVVANDEPVVPTYGTWRPADVGAPSPPPPNLRDAFENPELFPQPARSEP